MLNSFLNQSVERSVMIPIVNHKVLFKLCVLLVRECIYELILSDAGLSAQAVRRLSPLHSYCFCGVCNGNCFFHFIYSY